MIPVVLVGQLAQLAVKIFDLGTEGPVLLPELLLLPGQALHLVTESGELQLKLLLFCQVDTLQ